MGGDAGLSRSQIKDVKAIVSRASQGSLGTSLEETRILEGEEKLAKPPASNDKLPRGTIIAWYATPGNTLPDPTVWSICDGTNSTPDLRSRFVRGVAAVAEIGADLGAQSTHTHSARAQSSNSTVVFSTTKGPDDLETRFGNHEHPVSVHEASHIPPNYRLIYLMKL